MLHVAAEPSRSTIANWSAAGEPGFRAGALEAGASLFIEGETVDKIYDLVSGIVRLSKMLPDGRRQILGFLFPGEIFTPSGFAISHGGCATCSADAVTAVEVVTHRHSNFDGLLASRPELTRSLLATAAKSLFMAQQQMLLLGRMSATERLVWFLLRMAEQQDVEAGEPIRLPMSRVDIADYLGLTMETVSRVFRRLRERNIIALKGATQIRIVDPGRARQTRLKQSNPERYGIVR